MRRVGLDSLLLSDSDITRWSFGKFVLFFFYVFIYLCLAALSHCCFPWTSSNCSKQKLPFFVGCKLLVVVSIVMEQDAWAPAAVMCEPRHTGLVALQHVESSWMRDQTRILCIGKSKFAFFWYQVCVETTVKLPRILLLYLI